jgi:hypothetical protein
VTGNDNLGMGSALSIVNHQYSYDIYPNYGGDGQLINIADGWTSRSVKWQFDALKAGTTEKEILNGALVTWIVPTANTMIHPVSTLGPFELEYNDEGQLVDESMQILTYTINPIYVPAYANNTITCEIKDKLGNTYKAEKTFVFSTYGNSGTDYTLLVYEVNGKQASVNNDNMELKANLYDADLKLVENAEISYVYGNSTGNIEDSVSITTNSTDYSIFTAQTKIAWVGNLVTLQSKFAVPWSSNEDYYYQGPTTIMYNSNGTTPTYYRGPIKLLNKSTNEQINNIAWEITGAPNGEETWYPQIVHNDDSTEYRL